MSPLLHNLRRIATDMNQSGFGWCLVGGLAASVYAEPRTTKDVDVAVSVSGEGDLLQLLEFLKARGYSKPQVLMHVSPTRRMGWRVLLPASSAGNFTPLDLLSSACGIEVEIVSRSKKIELLPGLTLPVASLGDLIAMKILSQNSADRIQDRADVLALLRSASPDDRQVAQDALTHIAQSGLAAGRDLASDFAELLALGR